MKETELNLLKHMNFNQRNDENAEIKAKTFNLLMLNE